LSLVCPNAEACPPSLDSVAIAVPRASPCLAADGLNRALPRGVAPRWHSTLEDALRRGEDVLTLGDEEDDLYEYKVVKLRRVKPERPPEGCLSGLLCGWNGGGHRTRRKERWPEQEEEEDEEEEEEEEEKRRRRWWGTGGSAVATATGRLRVLFDPPHLSSDGGPRR
jgi:hypothetical protein